MADTQKDGTMADILSIGGTKAIRIKKRRDGREPTTTTENKFLNLTKISNYTNKLKIPTILTN